MKHHAVAIALAGLCCGVLPAAQDVKRPAIDEAALLRDLGVLAADDMQGRKPGTPGHDRAREFIVRRFRESGLEPVNGTYEQPFALATRREPASTLRGTNIVGIVRGTGKPDLSVVVTAHYDHVGVVNGQIFNGADDNASGTAALFALARHFATTKPAHTLVFAALDAEELGLRGARALLESPPVPISSIVLNVNLDMIGRDATDTLYAAGTSMYPFLKPYVERVAAESRVRLRLGHDGPGAPRVEDWTRESDHYAFHERGIPFIYFGVEDNAQHHKPTDDPATITRRFYANAAMTILSALREFDAHANAIAALRIAPRPAQFSDTVKPFIKSEAPVIALVHARVIDGTGAPARTNQTVLIRNGTIAQVGEDGLVAPPAGAVVMDLSGKSVMPGLVMVHEHLYYPTGPGVYGQLGESFIRLYLAGGVTTMRTGGNVNGFMDLKLKGLIDDGQQPGPALDATAPYLNGPNTFLQMRALEGPEDARRQVDYWADMGATSFKAYMNITRAELGAAVDEAHKRGMRVTGHLCSVTYAEAADLGIDDLEHGFLAATDFVADKQPDTCPGQSKGQQAVAALDENSPAFKALVKRLVDKHVALTSTLTVFETFTPGRPVPPGVDVLVPELKQQFEQLRERVAKNPQSAYAALLPKAMALERAFARAGGLLIAGTDPTGGGGVIPGYSNQRQLELLVEAGFTPLEAIAIGTFNGARYLGRDARIGTIATGKQADLLVIDGDPSLQIADVRKVETVFKQGVAFDPAKLIASVAGKVGLW
jgi:enamidase